MEASSSPPYRHQRQSLEFSHDAEVAGWSDGVTERERDRPPHEVREEDDTGTRDSNKESKALFRSPLNFKFFHSFSIISIFGCMYRTLNVDKKITNYTV